MPEPPAPKHLTLDIERKDNLVIVRCHGQLVSGLTDVLHSNVRPLIPTTKRIVLDLSDLTFMDSMGLGTVVRLYVSAKSAGSDLKLINLGKRIRHLLGISKLMSVLAAIEEYDVPIH